MLPMSLKLVLKRAQKQDKITQSRNNFCGLVFITVTHLTILQSTMIHQMQEESNGNKEKQNYGIQSLIYQVSLLRQRNRVLSLQNQNLIAKIEELQKQIFESSLTVNLLYKQQQLQKESKAKQKRELIDLIKYMENNFSSQSINLLEEMIKNECPTYAILGNLTQIMEQGLKIRQNIKKSDLNRLQRMILKRKEKLSQRQAQSRDIVHIVKQPTWRQSFLMEADLQYVVRSCEKIVRRVKKQNIDSQKISFIFNELTNFIKLRQNIREEEKMLKIQQRQLELGVGCRMSLETITTQMTDLQRQELVRKKQIEEKIFQL